MKDRDALVLGRSDSSGQGRSFSSDRVSDFVWKLRDVTTWGGLDAAVRDEELPADVSVDRFYRNADEASVLSPRERKIVELHYGLLGGRRHALREIGEAEEVTSGRVGQLLVRAAKKLIAYRLELRAGVGHPGRRPTADAAVALTDSALSRGAIVAAEIIGGLRAQDPNEDALALCGVAHIVERERRAAQDAAIVALHTAFPDAECIDMHYERRKGWYVCVRTKERTFGSHSFHKVLGHAVEIACDDEGFESGYGNPYEVSS